ncbi:hypothetical protein CALVIDRAFT_531123 [Calocera viscosa TUFC12733]|uniref:Uncharacterized protein n=1 Tax=Calocera viscosa (strain TUFC12733) TaxID=1330018 RepID=A0A167GUR5_CALVF|nr:hypothetical protein CALVIDRAFT_531123 [Calocera viscosa TUFC12733]
MSTKRTTPLHIVDGKTVIKLKASLLVAQQHFEEIHPDRWAEIKTMRHNDRRSRRPSCQILFRVQEDKEKRKERGKEKESDRWLCLAPEGDAAFWRRHVQACESAHESAIAIDIDMGGGRPPDLVNLFETLKKAYVARNGFSADEMLGRVLLDLVQCRMGGLHLQRNPSHPPEQAPDNDSDVVESDAEASHVLNMDHMDEDVEDEDDMGENGEVEEEEEEDNNEEDNDEEDNDEEDNDDEDNYEEDNEEGHEHHSPDIDAINAAVETRTRIENVAAGAKELHNKTKQDYEVAKQRYDMLKSGYDSKKRQFDERQEEIRKLQALGAE